MYIGGRQRVESAANRFERLDTNWRGENTGGASGVLLRRVTREKVSESEGKQGLPQYS